MRHTLLRCIEVARLMRHTLLRCIAVARCCVVHRPEQLWLVNPFSVLQVVPRPGAVHLIVEVFFETMAANSAVHTGFDHPRCTSLPVVRAICPASIGYALPYG